MWGRSHTPDHLMHGFSSPPFFHGKSSKFPSTAQNSCLVVAPFDFYAHCRAFLKNCTLIVFLLDGEISFSSFFLRANARRKRTCARACRFPWRSRCLEVTVGPRCVVRWTLQEQPDLSQPQQVKLFIHALTKNRKKQKVQEQWLFCHCQNVFFERMNVQSFPLQKQTERWRKVWKQMKEFPSCFSFLLLSAWHLGWVLTPHFTGSTWLGWRASLGICGATLAELDPWPEVQEISSCVVGAKNEWPNPAGEIWTCIFPPISDVATKTKFLINWILLLFLCCIEQCCDLCLDLQLPGRILTCALLAQEGAVVLAHTRDGTMGISSPCWGNRGIDECGVGCTWYLKGTEFMVRWLVVSHWRTVLHCCDSLLRHSSVYGMNGVGRIANGRQVFGTFELWTTFLRIQPVLLLLLNFEGWASGKCPRHHPGELE